MQQEIQKSVKNKEMKIFKKNTKMLLKFTKNYKKEYFFNKNNLKIIKNTYFLEIKQDKNDKYSYCKLYYNDKLIKIIYPFYPNARYNNKRLQTSLPSGQSIPCHF